MKKLPKVNKFNLSNDIHNNKQVFNSLEDKEEFNNKDSNKTLTVKEKVTEWIQSNNYIFTTKVKLIFEDKEKAWTKAGVVNNHLITMDNEIIKIDDLKDIIY